MFDDLNTFDFDLGYLASYFPIIELRKSHVWGERERQFPFDRRGRYVECDLIWGKGMLFCLQSGHFADLIWLSMPTLV
ncbi:coproporphyrinogen III oxidase [secondary endosymbiont of Ctenarytaina eucalypti]|uniref:coproporphyrinogen III oxidase n=1 Tax=secondary endosymbiont of Ctenarytaina eucalypti TaxID=1199245 RepID=UPI002DD6A6EF|nr:coproporphyrinogen III oxidase [secondary endosymbiont of Ctenarytaina eucalypti]